MTNNPYLSHANGARGEQVARAYLEQKGLHWVSSNYKAKVGEIDLIMKDAEQWVFVEVKYRSQQDYGSALQTFTPQKKRKVVKTAMCYLQHQGLNVHHTYFRIDFVAIDGEHINWINNV